MTTPSPLSGDVFFNSSGPPSSFLRQLLNEINGNDTSWRNSSPHNAPKSQADSHVTTRRGSSVWVGGTSIAQDARDKLRAADEARLRKPFRQGTDGTMSSQDFSPFFLGSHDSGSSSTSTSSIIPTAQSEQTITTSASREVAVFVTPDVIKYDASLPHRRPLLGGLRIPSSRFNIQPLASDDEIARAKSPLIFCDIDSDISLTPSPTEPPTSAITIESTQPSTAHESRSSSRPPSRSTNSTKRNLSPDDSPAVQFKKSRTMTMPVTSSLQCTRLDTTWSPAPDAMCEDNMRVIRDASFIERAPSDCHSYEAHTLPELSSFRPDITSPQGLAPRTPIRSSARRTSMPITSPYFSPAETPSFARPLHLVDTDISVYKTAHGEEWKENSLCLYCFRRHGSFNRVLTHGYEVCGREEVLKSHFWEPAYDPLMERAGIFE